MHALSDARVDTAGLRDICRRYAAGGSGDGRLRCAGLQGPPGDLGVQHFTVILVVTYVGNNYYQHKQPYRKSEEYRGWGLKPTDH